MSITTLSRAARESIDEEHVGYWDLEWSRTAEGRLSLRKRQASEEILSRTTSPVFIEITAQRWE